IATLLVAALVYGLLPSFCISCVFGFSTAFLSFGLPLFCNKPSFSTSCNWVLSLAHWAKRWFPTSSISGSIPEKSLTDSAFKFDKQVNAVVKASFYLLGTNAKIKSCISPKDLEKVIHDFISSRLDYCNSLYTGISHSSLSRLQLVQNAAARLLTGTRKRDHISPILASLHWLPVRFRVDFKVVVS